MKRLSSLNPRLRRQMALANAALVLGLMLWLFVHPLGAAQRDVRDAIVGLLLGLSVTANLFAAIKARRPKTGAADCS